MDVRRMKPKQKPKVIPMDKKIKPNPKYQNVQPVTDTGNNTRKQLERMEELRQYYRFRPDEIFRRVTVSSLVGLMIEVSKLEYQELDEAETYRKTSSVDSEMAQDVHSLSSGQDHHEQEQQQSSDQGCDGESLEDEKGNPDLPQDVSVAVENENMFESVVFKGKMLRRTLSTHSQLHSSLGDLIAGVSQLDVHRPHNQQVSSGRAFHHQNSWNAASLFNYDDNASSVGSYRHEATPHDQLAQPLPPPRQEAKLPPEEPLPAIVDRPFLLLDIRQVEDYERSHIIMARSYPANRLTRAVNFETREMLYYKNKEGKLIVVYDFDESIAHKFATTLVQRGYDNVFMLSGGIRITQIKFPKGLIRKGERKPSDEEEYFSEEDLHLLEEFLEEAQASGAGRMSSTRSLRLQSRLQSSLSNLPAVSGGSGAGLPHGKRALMHSPARAFARSTSIGRS